MAISFNNIPTTIRLPGAYNEIDNSRALTGLVQNPHKVLILGQKITAGTAATDTIQDISSNGLADGYFGPGSILARMCNVFKDTNEFTQLQALALSDAGAGAIASATVTFSILLSATGYSLSGAETLFLRVGGKKVHTALTSGWSATDVNSAVVNEINTDSTLAVTASTNAASALNILAVNNGAIGNFIDIRVNYGTGESNPTGFDSTVLFASILSVMEGGANNPDITDAWAVIEGEQFDHIIVPYFDADNLLALHNELDDRFGPLEDLQGHGYTVYPGAYASVLTKGNSNNSPYVTLMGAKDSPTPNDEWAASLGGLCSFYLNQDPARPLHFLEMPSIILAPAISDRFNYTERNNLLYDGVSTFIVDSAGAVRFERIITTYQVNALSVADPSYLNIQTMFTLKEISYQYKTRMVNRFIIPRFKLADDGFPVQAGSFIATPTVVKQEAIALFTLLRDNGLIENLDDFVDNIRVERNLSDRDRVDVLLPPDLINQFRILAGLIQFIL